MNFREQIALDRVDSVYRKAAVLRYLAAAALLCASLQASETEESLRQSLPASSATRLRLEADWGSVNVKPSASSAIDVEVLFHGNPPSRREFDRMLHDFSLKLTQQGSEVTAEALFTHGWEPVLSYMLDGGLFSGHAICHNWHCLVYSSWLDEIEIRIAVPRQFGVNLSTSGGGISVSQLKGEVNAHSSGGWLSFDRVEGPINANTSGGGISLIGVTGRSTVRTSGGWIRVSDTTGDVDASTSGGWISIDTAAGRIRAHTSGGWIDAKGVSGSLDASTSGGPVTAAFIAQPRQECRISTSGGWINVSLPHDAHVDLDASASGGGVTTDFPVPYTHEHRQNELHAPINGGGPLFSIHTSGGWINVKKSGAI